MNKLRLKDIMFYILYALNTQILSICHHYMNGQL